MLTQDKDYCIILYEDAPNRGHWTALLKYGGLYEHFDSYGVKPDTQLKWIGAKRNRMLNQDEPYLTQLLEKEEEKYIYNNVATAVVPAYRLTWAVETGTLFHMVLVSMPIAKSVAAPATARYQRI